MKRFVLAFGAVVALAACASDKPDSGPPCPETVIVKDIANVTLFKPGEGRDLTDVTMEATITGFKGFCVTDFDDGAPSEVTVEITLLFEVSRGPANTDGQSTIRYVVAIADRAGVPFKKLNFESEIEFPGNRIRVKPFEELNLTIPLKPGENGGDYSVLVGFRMTPAQVEYNRLRGR